MSSEESYLAILRYLTNEREPYAPGTEGNVKRKIRKAAACYVVRSGTLYYQRRHRDKERFTELEVVLQSERRKGLIEMAHIGAGGEHLTRHQTWHLLSQRYWWRGILKEMKDYIKKCSKCQEKADRSRSSNDPSEMLEEFGLEVCLDGNETDEELGNSASGANADPKASRKKPVAKHELVFVDSKGIVKQSSLKHGQAVLNQLNQQRLANQFCDVTLLIEGEEYKAHKSVLAASSEYFRELFIEKGAVSSHEAFVDLSGFCKASFLPLLEFVYTSELRFDFCSMADLVMLARHLFMHEVLEICELVHKQMEEKRLTLYQKGDVQTVASEADVQVVHVGETGIVGTPKLSVVKEVANGQKIVTLENVKCQAAEEVIASAASQPNTISTTLSVEATLQLTNDSGIPVGSVDGAQVGSVDGTTAIFISNSTSDQQPTVLIPTVIDVSSGEPQQTVQIIQGVITSEVQLSTEPSETFTNFHGSESQEMPVHESVVEEKADLTRNALSSEDTAPLDAEGSPCVDEAMDVEVNEDQEHKSKIKETLKRKRGKLPTSSKSAAVEGSTSQTTSPDAVAIASDDGARASNLGDQSSGTDTSPSQSPGSSEMDPYKSKLRERSVGEGGYIQLHRGKEKKNFNRKSVPKSAVQQAARRLVQRGKKRMLPPKKEVPQVEEEHTCKECGMVFQRKYALIMHSMKHDCVKEFKCPLCQKEFQYRASLRTHLIRHSRKTEPAAEETEAIKGRTKRQYICDICGRTLPKMCSLRLHMLKHTGVKPHACQICQKTFTHKHGLKMHQALHDSQKQFKCDLCDKSFVTNRSLQEHVSTHTGETKYLCTVCGKTFHRASGLSKHLKKHRPKPEVREYRCTECERSFSEARDLQQHMNKHLGVKPFECEVCGKCYSWKKDWYSHVKSHSVTEPYRCNICGKEFYEKSLFRRHVNKATHGKKGRIKRNVERICNHCGKTFTQLREFRRHVNNHEGVKPFECLTCGVAWADARSLKRHVRTHTGERPYVCPVCNEAYIDARNLRKHMTKYHSNYIPCKIMLEKDSLQFHHQGTQVEHAVSFMPNEAAESHSAVVTEEIETVLVTGDVLETVEDVSSTQNSAVSLSDQSIMQVVNYVLAQQQGVNLPEETDHIETVEVEVSEVL